MLDVTLLDVKEDHLPHLRALTKVTMEHKKDAMLLMETLSGTKLPYDVVIEEDEEDDGEFSSGEKTKTQYFRIGIEVAHEQTYRKELQQRMTDDHHMKVQEWIATSEMQRMEMMARRALMGLIPEFDTEV